MSPAVGVAVPRRPDESRHIYVYGDSRGRSHSPIQVDVLEMGGPVGGFPARAREAAARSGQIVARRRRDMSGGGRKLVLDDHREAAARRRTMARRTEEGRPYASSAGSGSSVVSRTRRRSGDLHRSRKPLAQRGVALTARRRKTPRAAAPRRHTRALRQPPCPYASAQAAPLRYQQRTAKHHGFELAAPAGHGLRRRRHPPRLPESDG